MVIIGAGPAGLTAAHELEKLGFDSIVLEQDSIVGGISRTVSYHGFRFDIGGHRFFTKVPEVQSLWEKVLGDDLLSRPRLSRIYYDDKFFDYPLKPLNALRGLGVVTSVRVLLSYIAAQIAPHEQEDNFEQWVTNRFGRRLYEIFFKTYTEKVWGVPCDQINADWAAQRIKDLDLLKAVRNALIGTPKSGQIITTLIDRFHYPRHGPGMMWQRLTDELERDGVPTVLGSRVVRLTHAAGRIETAVVSDRQGNEKTYRGSHFISSMPLGQCLEALDPAAPAEVLEAARSLRYRDFLTVVLIVDQRDVFPDNWIYIHSPKVRVGRVQNFKNWSPEMVPDPAQTALGLEYFVHEGDDLWSADDSSLIAFGSREMEIIGLLDGADVVDGTVVRMKKAYPVYDADYRQTVGTLRAYFDRFENLQIVGRNGQHRYNNQDHSMLAAMLAARNIAGAHHDVWAVNVEPEYHETKSTDRLVPSEAAERDLEELVVTSFARYDPVALGGAIATVIGIGLFAATATLLVRGGPSPGQTLSLLGNYFLGYDASWPGAFVALVEGCIAGFGGGYLLAKLINSVVTFSETSFRRQLQLAEVLDPVEAPLEAQVEE